MFDEFISFFDELSRAFRVVDAVDILLVSVFLYAALRWFQKTASRGVLIGVGVLAAVYFLARGLDMYLTSLAFHATFAILVFMLIVVFQEDMRRMFERVSDLRSVRLARQQEHGLNVDALVEAAFHMAATKTGALLVLKGKEALERHCDGGIHLGGRVSKPLLYSIFDSSSPGHDGAVIIDRDRIVQFAAHLPISKNSKEISGRGTRHSAALGLSECSDALIIVVSEERGAVSVAQAGVLRVIPTSADLKRRVEQFLQSVSPVVTQPVWRITQHAYLKLLALGLAITAWFVLAYDPHTIQRTFVAPIVYRNLPKDLVFDLPEPAEAQVTLTGSERDFRFLDPASLKITVDLAKVGSGMQLLSITEKDISLPVNLSLYRVEPRVLRLYFSRPPPAAVSNNPG